MNYIYNYIYNELYLGRGQWEEEREDMKCNDTDENVSNASVAGMDTVKGMTVGDEVREVPGSHIIKGQKVILL